MPEHKTADPKELEVQTEPEVISLGVLEAERGSPRPDLNGFRVKSPASPAIYLIDRGYRRWIPNPATYNNLFRSWGGIIVDINIDEIPLASSISNGAILARPIGQAPVYLVDRGRKRHVASPAAMDKYHFSWDRVYNVPEILLSSILDGPSIS